MAKYILFLVLLPVILAAPGCKSEPKEKDFTPVERSMPKEEILKFEKKRPMKKGNRRNNSV